MDNKNMTWLYSIVATFLAIIFVTIAAWHCTIVKIYVEAGYTRTTLPGADMTYWVKPKEELKKE